MLALLLALQVAADADPGTLVRRLAWTADGLVVAVRDGDGVSVSLRGSDLARRGVRFAESDGANVAVSASTSVISGSKGRVRVVALKDGGTIAELDVASPSPVVALSADGRRLAASGKPIRVWDSAGGKPVCELEQSARAGTLLFSPDGSRIAATQSPAGLGIWDAADGRLLQRLDAPFHCADHLAFSPDGRHLVYAAPDRLLRVWRTADGALVDTLPGQRFRPVFSPDGRFLAVVEPGHAIRLLSFPSLAPAGEVGRHASYPLALAFSPDGTRIATGHADGSLLIWQAPKPKKIVLLAAEPDDHPPGTHLYVKNARVVQRGLEAAYGAAVKVELHPKGWPEDPKTLDDADAIFLTSAGGDRKLEMHPFYVGDRFAAVEKQMKRGCGLMFFHWSTFHPAAKHDLITEWVGGYFDYESGPAPRKWYSAIETKDWTTVLPAADHAIARGVQPFKLREEFYFRTRFRENDPRLVPFLLCREGDPKETAVGWAVERADGGRGVGFTGGHFYRNWASPDFRKLVLNAVAWIAKLEVPAGGVASEFVDETSPDVARVSLSLKEATLKQALDAISKKTGLVIQLDETAKKKLGESVDVEFVDLTVSAALMLIAVPLDLKIDVIPGGVKLVAP